MFASKPFSRIQRNMSRTPPASSSWPRVSRSRQPGEEIERPPLRAGEGARGRLLPCGTRKTRGGHGVLVAPRAPASCVFPHDPAQPPPPPLLAAGTSATTAPGTRTAPIPGTLPTRAVNATASGGTAPARTGQATPSGGVRAEAAATTRDETTHAAISGHRHPRLPRPAFLFWGKAC